MSEFMYVTHPAIYPQACAICTGSKGPLVDTMREGTNGRVYVCQMCVKRCALALGLIEGERMEQLMNAGNLLDEARKALELRDATIQSQLAEIETFKLRVASLEEQLEIEKAATQTQRHLFEQLQRSLREGIEQGAAA